MASVVNSTPQVLGSTPGGSEFQAEVKKIPSPAYKPKHMEIGPGSPRPALTRVTVWVTAPLCKGGAGVRGFLGLRERSSSYVNARGAACPLQIEFFFLNRGMLGRKMYVGDFLENKVYGD